MKEYINVNPPPTSPKPEYKSMQQEKEDQGYGQLTNAEVYAMLSLALMELEKINARLNLLLQDGALLTTI